MAGSGICRVIQPTKALSSHSDHVIGYKFVLSPTYDAEKREGEEVEVDGEKRPKQDTPHHFDLDTLKHFYGSHCPPRFMRRYSVSRGGLLRVADLCPRKGQQHPRRFQETRALHDPRGRFVHSVSGLFKCCSREMIC